MDRVPAAIRAWLKAAGIQYEEYVDDDGTLVIELGEGSIRYNRPSGEYTTRLDMVGKVVLSVFPSDISVLASDGKNTFYVSGMTRARLSEYSLALEGSTGYIEIDLGGGKDE